MRYHAEFPFSLPPSTFSLRSDCARQAPRKKIYYPLMHAIGINLATFRDRPVCSAASTTAWMSL